MHLENRCFLQENIYLLELQKWFKEKFASATAGNKRYGDLRGEPDEGTIEEVKSVSTSKNGSTVTMCVWATVWVRSEGDYAYKDL